VIKSAWKQQVDFHCQAFRRLLSDLPNPYPKECEVATKRRELGVMEARSMSEASGEAPEASHVQQDFVHHSLLVGTTIGTE
jgi:hypothetical protein